MNKLMISLSLAMILGSSNLFGCNDQIDCEIAAVENSIDSAIYKEAHMKQFGGYVIERDNSQMEARLENLEHAVKNLRVDYHVFEDMIILGVDNINKQDMVMLIDYAVKNSFDASIIDHNMVYEMDGGEEVEWRTKYEDILMLQYFGPSTIVEY